MKIKNIQNLLLMGGGVMRLGETKTMDKWILKKAKESNGRNPKVMFIPAGSNDLKAYVVDFEKKYRSYGATVNTLKLVKSKSSKEDVALKILKHDVVYFGGGDAELLMKVFKKYNLEKLCKKMLSDGKIICGLSAGAAIWGNKYLNFEWDGSKFVNFKSKIGLNWFDCLIFTHYTKKLSRRKEVAELIESENLLGIGDQAAVYFDNINNINIFKTSKNNQVVFINKK